MLPSFISVTRHSFRMSFRISKLSTKVAAVDYSSVLSPKENSTVQNLFKGVIAQKRASLAESITLVESTNPRRKLQSRMLLELVLENLKERESKNSSKTFRIGLSGPPGAGKSTFIESFGTMLTEMNYRIAILAVDPSSKGTGGSLLADKTRMPELSRNPKAYIRPSPSCGNLGGVARNTNDAVVMCEGAGYDIIIIETVGVGQSEFAVADMVDLFCLLIPPAGGDELQGIKKGIVEAADLVVVNKFDGDLMPAARRVAAEYMSALKFVRPRSQLWKQKVLKVSSINKGGLKELWESMTEFEKIMRSSGELEYRRRKQLTVWMWNYVREEVLLRFSNNPAVREVLPAIEKEVIEGAVTPGHAAEHLLKLFATSES